MNIDEYCQRILTSNNLADKLKTETVNFNHFTVNHSLPSRPGRPKELCFATEKSVKLPNIQQLEEPLHRGRLLHYFFNHELLALEIMALVLLKFPELPLAFQKILLKTMADEQKHARFYLERMHDFGVQPGDMPVNSFFWDCFKDISQPMQFVSGMSLTFEQANLDFLQYYMQIFTKIGDHQTKAALQEVYDDEVIHVSHGLKWFRNWKENGLSDWTAYVQSLTLPLSPVRAKGKIFDRQVRQKIGFDQDFIDRLEVESNSKGRSPDVYVFNAFMEESIVLGKSFNIPQWGVTLEKDLGLLPLVFTGEDDILLVREKPSLEFLAKLQKNGLVLPQIISYKNQASPLNGQFPRALKPWGWCPQIAECLTPLLEQQKFAKLSWIPQFQDLFSKCWAVNFSKNVNFSHPWIDQHRSFSMICKTLSEVEKAFECLLQKKYVCLAVKSPFGASGRGILRFPNGQISTAQRQQLQHLLLAQQQVIVEPWVERQVDFSVHFDVGDQVSFVGLTRLFNDDRGQYMATAVGQPFAGLDVNIMKLLQPKSAEGIYAFYETLALYLTEALAGSDYRGPLGIDLFLYHDTNGELHLRPIVEVNFRYTMGRVALQLEKKIASGKIGLLKIFSQNATTKATSPLPPHSEMQMNKAGQWLSGILPLSEWRSDSRFSVVLSVGKSLQDCF